MKSKLKITHLPEQYLAKVQDLINTLQADAECERDDDKGIHCYCMNCRMGAGSFSTTTDGLLYYETGSGKGQYWFFKDGILFQGYRNSFMDGTEFFHASDFVLFGDWKVVNSSQMWRDPFEVIEERV